MIYIESEGALFRGHSRAWPGEVWSRRQHRWLPYHGRTPKDVDWGTEVSDGEARDIMGEAPPAGTETGNAATFLRVYGKYSFIIRLCAGEADFFNRKTLCWNRWPRPIPAPARPISKAAAWRSIYQETMHLDFGTLDRPYREWPEPAAV
jgi:hypothetical protein